jgi:GTP1/Obg family GTP-binding protein
MNTRRLKRELIVVNRIFDAAEQKEILAAVHEAERVSELETALTEAVEIIKQWHNMPGRGTLTKEEQERMWEIYRELSPEMRPINAALKGKSP